MTTSMGLAERIKNIDEQRSSCFEVGGNERMLLCGADAYTVRS